MKINQNILLVFVGLAAIALFPGCAGIPVHASASVLTTKNSFLQGKLIAQKTYRLEDVIRFHVDLTWDDVTREAGIRQIKWNWYKDGILVASDKNDNAHLMRAPSARFTMRPAVGLGRGHFKVEGLVDDIPMASEEFDIQ